ncbi:MAG: rhomboid family intramembrane serine protease [Deltaproteobacteria bacterium]|nr:rhomboid family intramembrane serine protease [Deltaproteobacteria bacterium]
MSAPPERQPPLPEWLRPVAQRFSPFIKWLVIVETLAYFMYATAPAARDFIVSQLALGPNMATGKFWQPVSALFVHVDPLTFAINIIGVWFLASAMEVALGRARFLLVFFVPAILGHLAQGVASALLGNVFVAAGCGLSVLAVIVAFGVHYDRTPARIWGRLILPARGFAALLVLFSLSVELVSHRWPAMVGTVVSVLMSYVLCGGKGEPIAPPKPARPSRPRVQMQVLEGGKGKTDPRYLN